MMKKNGYKSRKIYKPKFLALIIIQLIMMQFFTMSVYAIREAPPSEKVVAQNGRWQLDYYSSLESGGQEKLMCMYIGSKDQSEDSEPVPFQFSVKKEMKLTKLFVVFRRLDNDLKNDAAEVRREASQGDISTSTADVKDGDVLVSVDEEDDEDVLVSVAEDEMEAVEGVTAFSEVLISIVGSDGKGYGPYKAQLEMSSLAGQAPPKDSVGSVLFDQNIVLEKGSYTIEVSNIGAAIYNSETGNSPAVLLAGVDYNAWEEYQKWLRAEKYNADAEDEGKKDGEKDEDTGVTEYGRIMVLPDSGESSYESPNQDVSNNSGQKPALGNAIFTLTEECYIDEIQTDHYNGGSGAVAGTIKLVSEAEGGIKTHGTWNAKGLALDGIQNAVWSVSPGIVLPPGTYTIVDSGTNTLSYDFLTLEPMFYVRATEPPTFDFTGTYFINVKTAMTNSMNPSKVGKPSAFDRDGFEIAVIDRGNAVEIIGRYTQEKKKDIYFGGNSTEYDFKDVPFSQLCEVVERDGTTATVIFSFGIDLSNLPYKANVGTNVLIKFDSNYGSPKMTGTGTAHYSRAYSKKYGGDNNAYSVNTSGQRASAQLPYYVQAQIVKVGNIGNVPGPETPEQGAAGVLFPPLGALIIQIALTMKKPKIIIPDPENESGDGFGGGGNDRGDDGGGDSGDDSSGGVGSDGDDGGYDGDSGAGEDDSGGGGYDDDSSGGGGYDDDSSGGNSGYDSGEDRSGNAEGNTSKADNNEYDKNSQEQGAAQDQPEQNIDRNSGQTPDQTPDQNPGLPADGEEKTLKGTDGRDYNLKFDSGRGTWVNTESGNNFDVDRFDQWQRDIASEREFSAEQTEKMQNRDTSFDREMDKLVQQEKERGALIKALGRMQKDSYGIGTEVDPNKVASKIDDLIDDLISRDKSLEDVRNDAFKAARVVNDFRTGTAIDDASAKRINDRDNFTEALGLTAAESMQDIIQGRTWAGMAGRMAIAIATGGATEIPMSVAEGMMDIKDNIDKGYDGLSATGLAIGKYVVGELGGEGASRVIGKALQGPGKYIMKNYGGQIKRGFEYLNKPVSEAFEESLVGKSMKQLADRFGTTSSKQAGEGFGKEITNAADKLEYNRYMKDAAQKVDNLIKKVNAGGNDIMVDASDGITRDEIKAMLRDPAAMRLLKNAPGKTRAAFNEALNSKLYRPTDIPTKNQLESLNMGRNVEVESIRTPGTKGSKTAINTDNDVFATKKVQNSKGEVVTKEIDRHIVEGLRTENFGKAAGVIKKDGSFDITRASSEMPDVDWKKMNRTEQLAEYSKRHNQEVTDVFSPEGSIDYSTNSSSIRRDGMPEGISNISSIEKGNGKLLDAEQLGKMDVYKVDKYLKNNNITDQCEGFEQLGKMGNMADRLTKAYQNNGYNVSSISKEMKKALEVVNDKALTPLQRTQKIQQLGFKGPMDLANKLSGRIEGLKMAKPMDTNVDPNAVQRVVSRILKSRFNENE